MRLCEVELSIIARDNNYLNHSEYHKTKPRVTKRCNSLGNDALTRQLGGYCSNLLIQYPGQAIVQHAKRASNIYKDMHYHFCYDLGKHNSALASDAHVQTRSYATGSKGRSRGLFFLLLNCKTREVAR